MRTIIPLVLTATLALGMGMAVNAAGPYDGTWAGTTDQGDAVSFTVNDNQVTTFSIKYKVRGSVCTATSEMNLTITPGAPISNNTFSLSSHSFVTDPYTFSGTFLNLSECSGMWDASNDHCNGSGNGTWSAVSTSAPSTFEEGCASFEGASNTLHLPCVSIAGNTFWIDFELMVVGEDIKIRLGGFGLSQNMNGCSTFDMDSLILHIPCFDLDASYWLDFILEGNDGTLILIDFGAN